MTISRRFFLGGLLTGVTAPAIVSASNLMPIWVPKRLTLYGDGIHDDTKALQSLISGNQVVNPNGRIYDTDIDGYILVPPFKTYLISETLLIPVSTVRFKNAIIKQTKQFTHHSNPMIRTYNFTI